MSTIKVTGLQVNGTLTANTITNSRTGTSINSTMLVFGNSSLTANYAVVNSSSVSVGTSGANTILQATISEGNITVGGNTVTSLPTGSSEICNVQIFTANGTWTKPSWATTGYELVFVHMWGGGGGSNTGGTTLNGGGGGAFVYGIYMGSQVNSTANVVVGLGGTLGVNGGNSSFANSTGGLLTAYGGGAANTTSSGGGGGWLGVGAPINGGGPLGGNSTINASTFGGGGMGVNSQNPGSSIYGGGAGGYFNNTAGSSIYGGGGGGGANASGNAGISIYGGFGANSTVAAGIPGGGGALANSTFANNTAGARGEVRVYTLRKTA
jgi:hypothetical protein